jgi:hypothetical protein
MGRNLVPRPPLAISAFNVYPLCCSLTGFLVDAFLNACQPFHASEKSIQNHMYYDTKIFLLLEFKLWLYKVQAR